MTNDFNNSPSLKHWGEISKEKYFDKIKNDAFVECGWGRLVFAHTFKDYKDILKVLRGEKDRLRDVALYAHEPQLLISYAPHEFFLDPSLTLRYNLEKNDINDSKPVNFYIERSNFKKDLEQINSIYTSNNMVTIDKSVLAKDEKIVFFVAKDKKTDKVLGVVMGADHVEIFKDNEKGSSLWALAVDPQASYPGIGTALVNFILSYYQKLGRKFLDLSVLNESMALKLYENMGFEQVPAFIIKRKNAINEKLYTHNVEYNALNPYSMIIIKEAKLRGIGVDVIDPSNNYFQLTHSGRSIICRESLCELTSAVAMSRCADKSVTHNLLKPLNISLPDQHIVNKSDDDYKFLQKHKHIAVKPADGEQGQGISLLVRSNAELELAIKKAKKISKKVVLEEFVEGDDLRILVINFEMVAAAIRKPAGIVGDGKHSVKELIQKQSRRREMATEGESTIPLDDETKRTIFNAGYTYDDILETGKKLQVRKTANLHTGGTIHDVTAKLHPDLAQEAIKIARTINIPVVGIDFMVKSVEKSEYYFIEANERPGLANHEPQPTAAKFIDMLFPNTKEK